MRKVKLLIAVLLLSLVVSVPAIAGTWADVPQRIFEGEAFVPLRLTAYANNAAVEWDGLAHSVNITFASGNTYIVRVDAVGGFIEDGTLWIPYEYAVRIFAVDVPVVQFESSIPLDIAADLLAETAALWDADAGELWGFHLHAPLMIADPLTRHAVTNMPDPEGNFHPMGGVYVGILPGHVFISHTITDFAGLTWGMMAWEPGMEYIITYHMDAIIRLLVHEGFHAIQFIEIVSGDWPRYADQRFEYLNFSADARITVLMEVYALAEAVRSEGDERIQAIHDALSVRAHRRALLPEAAISENAQEINEGLAMFTEILYFSNALDLMEFYLPWITAGEESTGLSMFLYFSGAMYAVLLMDTDADWQTGITFETDLAALLQDALDIEITPFDQLDLERLGYFEIAPVQRAWVIEYQRMLEGAEDFVAQPWTLIPGDSFMDTASAVSVESFFVPNQYGWTHLIFYGEFAYIGSNWHLSVSGGFISPSWYPNTGINVRLYEDILINDSGTIITAPTWTLEITDSSYFAKLDSDGRVVITQR